MRALLVIPLAVVATTVGVRPGVPRLAAQVIEPTGTYALFRVGDRALPVVSAVRDTASAITLCAGTLELANDGTLHGMIVARSPDGVTDTLTLRGRWSSTGKIVQISYTFSLLRRRRDVEPAYAVGERVTGLLVQSELQLPELAYFDRNFIGAPVSLRFRRI